MKLISSALFFCLASFLYADAESDFSSAFHAAIESARAKYRAGQSDMIRKADRVIIYLVAFDTISKEEIFENGDDVIKISSSSGVVNILETKEVGDENKAKILDALAKQIAKPEHNGGAMCHFPIHGIRVYRGEKLLHEGTLCWMCGNFSFSYPEGFEWLDTSKELEAIFTTLLPIPQKELDRFYKKYPNTKPKGVQNGEGEPGNEMPRHQ